MDDLIGRASSWLTDTYGGQVALDAPQPLVAGERAVLFGCGHVAAGEPMLAAAVWVPRDGGEPFPAANSEPLDEQLNLAGSPGERAWRWRANAYNCLVAIDAAVDRRPAVALPWRPDDERPGGWDRLLTRNFPGAEVSTCASWPEVSQAIMDGGVDTRGVVWLRRELDGRPLTGHLLYVDRAPTGAVVLDGQRGGLARLADDETGELVLARFHRPPVAASEEFRVPWEAPADDFAAAVEKATRWLEFSYDGAAELVDPDPADETARGWLFACTSSSFLASGDWREQMLDAALVVPKAAGQAPFGLPNHDPWGWLQDWDEGRPVATPPQPGEAAWFGPTMAQIGAVTGSSVQPHWAGVLDEITTLPAQARALVWVRRKDHRGRETVGHALWAINAGAGGVRILDPMSADGAPLMDQDPFELRVVRIG